MTTAVVIPTYNGTSFLRKNLPAVVAMHPDEIVVVDDASSDDTFEFLSKHYPAIRVLRHATNTRFPKSANDGFAATNADIVILLNQDVTPKSDLLKHVKSNFDNPRLFAVTFNEGKRSWAKAAFVKGFIEFSNGPLDSSVHESFWASGGSAAFRNKMWQELGGFDETYKPGYFEDLDIGFRAHKRGLHIIWDPKARVDHETETSIPKLFTHDYLTRVKERNYLLSHWKNLSWKNLLTHKFFLFKRVLEQPGYIIPLCMALVHLPYVLLFRMYESRKRILTDEQIFAKCR